MKRVAIFLAVTALIAQVGCRQKMENQPRYTVYQASGLFEDSTSARPLPKGTVARGQIRRDASFYNGTNPYYDEQGDYAGSEGNGYEKRLTKKMPFPATRSVLERGQNQFNIYCSPCHGRLGNGKGMIVSRGLHGPPSYHSKRLRNAPIGHFFNVITNGYGAMYSYAARVKPEDRWAIAAYIRALQLSQHAKVEDVPKEKRGDLKTATTPPETGSSE